jgi:hypothetical protein
MSAFDDIAEDDLRDLHAAAPFARDGVFGQGADIDDKCNELLRITRYIPLEFQPTPRFVELLQEIWSDAQERERLLSPDRVVAERLADVAQRVRSCIDVLAFADKYNKGPRQPNLYGRLPPLCTLFARETQCPQQSSSPFVISLRSTTWTRSRCCGWGPLCGHLQRITGNSRSSHQTYARLRKGGICAVS